jgi:hypothetical protein
VNAARRRWILAVVRDALTLARVDREAGRHEAARRWLALAAHLRALISRPAEGTI